MKPDEHNELLDCWDPAGAEAFRDVTVVKCPLAIEREQAGLCGEAQSDGVPCTDPKRLCEACGRAH